MPKCNRFQDKNTAGNISSYQLLSISLWNISLSQTNAFLFHLSFSVFSKKMRFFKVQIIEKQAGLKRVGN